MFQSLRTLLESVYGPKLRKEQRSGENCTIGIYSPNIVPATKLIMRWAGHLTQSLSESLTQIGDLGIDWRITLKLVVKHTM
jgi:hypothetical protein